MAEKFKDMVRNDLIIIYLRNSRNVCLLREKLEKTLVRKINKEETISVEYLAKSSATQNMLRVAIKVMKDNEPGFTVTSEGRKEAALQYANEILDGAKYLATVSNK